MKTWNVELTAGCSRMNRVFQHQIVWRQAFSVFVSSFDCNPLYVGMQQAWQS